LHEFLGNTSGVSALYISTRSLFTSDTDPQKLVRHYRAYAQSSWVMNVFS
jgi:hypothetical protein